MIDTLHWLVARYGLIAVFLGCVAEGESAAILGGFFADGVGFDLIPVSVQVETPRAIFGLAYRFEPDPIVAR